MSHFKGHFEGAKTFLTFFFCARDNLGVKKNYVPQFLKQRDINSYTATVPCPTLLVLLLKNTLTYQ